MPGNPAGPTSSVSGLTDLGDTLLFTARTPAYGAELMKLTLAPALVTVVGTLFNDRNVDGRRNAAEAALAGWQVRVRSGGETGPIVGTAVTDATGAYRVGDLAATDGPFFIQPDLPPGWTLTGPVAVIATVGPGSLVQADFSAVQGSVVFGTVYDDTNLDGTYQVRQAGHNDDPLPGWVVFADLDGNGIANGSDPVAITNTVGNYVLGPLPQRPDLRHSHRRTGTLPRRLGRG